MPFSKKIVQGETVEIRCKLVKKGNFQDAQYNIRYFQSDGIGELRLDDNRVLTPNDPFLLNKGEFNLYYTSHCTDQQNIEVVIIDAFGQEVKKTFSFENQYVEPEPETDEKDDNPEDETETEHDESGTIFI